MKITIDDMKNMNIDSIIDLYRQGYVLEDINAKNGINVKNANENINIKNLQCSITVISDVVTAEVGSIIRLTATISPPIPESVVVFKANDILIGECDGSTGTCSVYWDTTGYGTGPPYYVTAEILYACVSEPIPIKLTTPPPNLENILLVAGVAIPSVILAAYYLFRKTT